jgi:hypothetical protein
MKMRLGGITNIDTSEYGNPYSVIDSIQKAKYNDLDILIGPEWSLTCRPGLYNRNVKTKKSETWVELLFNAPDYIKYAPKDARNILEEGLENDFKKFTKIPAIPYSKREYENMLKDIKYASKGSDMLIFPGTAMFYDENRVLYNVMPVISNGKIVKNIYKFHDGLSSRFNLENALKLYPYNKCNKEDYSFSYGKNPIINFNGIKTSVEICADAGMLKRQGVNGLDLQVLSSCGNSATDRVINKQGYLAVVDGLRNATVYVSSMHIPKLKPVEKFGELHIFDLEFGA